MLTEKDRQLIKEAESLVFVDWARAFDLVPQADSEEAKDRLRAIGRRLCHIEEYYAGSL